MTNKYGAVNGLANISTAQHFWYANMTRNYGAVNGLSNISTAQHFWYAQSLSWYERCVSIDGYLRVLLFPSQKIKNKTKKRKSEITLATARSKKL
jgi:hypothetical protein